MSFIPREVLDKLDHAATAMDDMNSKLDRVIILLERISVQLTEETA